MYVAIHFKAMFFTKPTLPYATKVYLEVLFMQKYRNYILEMTDQYYVCRF